MAEKDEILHQNQLPGPRNARRESGVCFRDASPCLSEVPAASAPLWLGLHTALLSAPKHRYWPYSGDRRCRETKTTEQLGDALGGMNLKKKVEVVIMDVIKALYAGHAYNALCICTGSKWGRAQAQISSLEVCCSTKKK